jgi:hypothetical protein
MLRRIVTNTHKISRHQKVSMPMSMIICDKKFKTISFEHKYPRIYRTMKFIFFGVCCMGFYRIITVLHYISSINEIGRDVARNVKMLESYEHTDIGGHELETIARIVRNYNEINRLTVIDPIKMADYGLDYYSFGRRKQNIITVDRYNIETDKYKKTIDGIQNKTDKIKLETIKSQLCTLRSEFKHKKTEYRQTYKPHIIKQCQPMIDILSDKIKSIDEYVDVMNILIK